MDRTDPPEEWPIDWEPGPGATALTVDFAFNWTGGTINDGDLAGQLNLAPGATGLAEPVNGGTVGLGSTITLLGNGSTQTGSTLELRDGTYSVLRGHFEVEKHSTLINAPVPAAAGTGVSIKPDGTDAERTEDGSIVNEGTVIFTSRGRNQSTVPAPMTMKGPGRRVTNTGSGVVRIESFFKLTLEITEIPDEDVVTAYRQYLPDEHQPCVTWLEAGSQIVSEQNAQVRIEEGDLNIVPVFNGGVPYQGVDQVAKITMGVPNGTPALVIGRTVVPSIILGDPPLVWIARINFPQTDAAFTVLDVNGRIDCAGDLSMGLSRSTANASDFIKAREMIFGGDTKVWLEWQCGSLLGNPVGENAMWDLVRVTENDGVNLTPGLEPPDPGPGGTHIVTLDRKETNRTLFAKK
jgi:hypothetical protein